MRRTMLPFEIDVEMIAYHSRAFPLGVIKANVSDYDIWLCNKLIPTALIDQGEFNAYRDDIWSLEDGLCEELVFPLDPDSSNINGINMVDFNRAMIDQGYYVTGSYNEYYIRGKEAYGKRTFQHDYIIIGYDDNIKAFKSAGYLADGHYHYFDIDYDAYHKSLEIIINTTNRMHYFKVNPSYSPSVDIVAIKRKLEEYLKSTEIRLTSGKRIPENIYGIAVWDKLAEYVENHKGKSLDLRYGRILMEYHFVMHKRLNTLVNNGFLCDADLVDQYYEKVYLKAKCAHHMFMKYNITQGESLLLRIGELIKQINKNCRSLIEAVIENIVLE